MKITKLFERGTDSSRMVQLDILRGVAILLVLFAHAVSPSLAGSLQPVLSYLHYLGPTGVDLFFVLSGFLVGGLLFKELHDKEKLDVRRFLIRRGFKIYPSYIVFIVFVFLSLIVVSDYSFSDSFWALMPNFLHLQNYLGSPREHTWSLAVEEHFYLALPFLLLLMTVRQKSKITTIPALPVVALSLFILCALFRLYVSVNPQSYNPHFATHLRLDSLFFGAMLAYYYQFEPHRLQFAAQHKVKLLCLATALLLVYPALIISDQSNLIGGTIGFIMLYIGYGCFLLVMVHTRDGTGRLGKLLNSFPARVVAYIGFFSYPVYLWHIEASRPVVWLFKSEVLVGLPAELRWVLAFIIYGLTAVATGIFFGVLLEKPSLAVRNRLFPARTGPAAEQPVGTSENVGPGLDHSPSPDRYAQQIVIPMDGTTKSTP